MKDVVTFCPDLDALKAELAALGSVDEEGNAILPLTRTPVQYSVDGLKSLALARFVDESRIAELAQLQNLEVLGTYDEIFAAPDKLAKYTSVYSLEPITSTDPQSGEKVTYTPPQQFGVFA